MPCAPCPCPVPRCCVPFGCCLPFPACAFTFFTVLLLLRLQLKLRACTVGLAQRTSTRWRIFRLVAALHVFKYKQGRNVCTHSHTLPYTRTNTHTQRPRFVLNFAGPRTFWRLGVNFFYALPKIISNTLPPARVVLVVLVLLLLLCAIVAVYQLIIVVVVVVLSLLLFVWWEGSKKRRRFRNVYSFRRVYEVNWKGHSVAHAACGTLWLWRHDRTNAVRSCQRSSTISLTRCTPVCQAKPAPSFVSVWQLERACAAQREREGESERERQRERAQSESFASSAGQLRGNFVFIFIWQLMLLPVRIALRRLPVLLRRLHSLQRTLCYAFKLKFIWRRHSKCVTILNCVYFC